VVAGADHIVDLFLNYVRLLASETDLVSPLIPLSVAFQHGVVTVGGAVVDGVMNPVILDCVFRRGAVKRSRHSGKAIGFGDVLMTPGAGSGINIA